MKGWILHKRSEHEIKPEMYELNRFIQVSEHFDINLEIIKPEQVDLIVTREDRKSILIDGKPVDLPDFLLPRMGSGTTYFAFAVIRHLERLGVTCFNNADNIEAVKDKLYTQQILAESNIPVPKTMLVKFPFNIELVEKYIGYPLIIKTLSGSQGKGVFLIEDHKSFINFINIVEIANSNLNIIIQEFIQNSFGRDLRVIVVGGRAISCMERYTDGKSFKANFSTGAEVREYKMTPEIEWLAVESTRLLGLDIAGVDLLFDGDHFKICEVNSSPGFEGMEKACSIDIPAEIFNYIKIRSGKFK